MREPNKDLHIMLNILAHLAWVLLVLYVWLSGPFDAPTWHERMADSLGIGPSHLSRSILSAYGMGSLDLVAVCLTVLGVAVAVFGLFGFLTVRRDAILEAKETAESTAAQTAIKYAKDEIADKLPELIDSNALRSVLTPELLAQTLNCDQDLKRQLALLISRMLKEEARENVSEDDAQEIAGAFDQDDLEGMPGGKDDGNTG